MGLCYLAPDRVKLTVNSKEETNSRVKMGKESKWASQTNSEQQERNRTAGSKWTKGQDGLLLFTS